MPDQYIPKTTHLDRRADQILRCDAAAGEDDDLLTTQQLAAWLGVSYQTLEIGRSRKGNVWPPFIRLSGRVRYRRADVRAWLATRMHRDTNEYRHNGTALTGDAPPPAQKPVASTGFRRGN